MTLPIPGAASRAGATTMATAPPQTNIVRCCSHCGGSGQQRLGDQRFRTCLNCLGQGQVLAEDRGSLSAVASASDAR